MYYKKTKKGPSYNFSDLKKACKEKNRNNIFIFDEARKGADKYFNLRTKDQILDFIYNDGLENRSFYNTAPWEKNPNKNSKTIVDAYEFESGDKRGYLAFMYSKITNKWIIKSFKLSTNANNQILQAIKKAGLMEKFNLEE
jgi:hypothetical protein